MTHTSTSDSIVPKITQPRLRRLAGRVRRRVTDIAVDAGLRVVNAFSRRIYLSHRPDIDADFRQLQGFTGLQDDWVRGLEWNNYGDIARLYALVLNLQRCLARGVEGAIAEVGVYKGNSAKILHQLAPDRRLYLFDTFAGFAGKDLAGDASGCGDAPFKDTTCERVAALFPAGADVRICQGWFPETATAVEPGERFAFVHLDCDLYGPTRAGLEYFYRRLSPGGLLLVHDYSNPHWPGVRQAVDEFLESSGAPLVMLPDKSGTGVIPAPH